MKKSILNLSGVIILGTLFIVSCHKKHVDPATEDTSTTTTTGVMTATPGFTYIVTGGATTVADSAFYYQQYKTIHAYKNGNANHFEINLSSLAVANYSIGSSNALTYVMGSSYLPATSGSISITENTNNKLSGNGVTQFTGGSINEISIRFKDIPNR